MPKQITRDSLLKMSEAQLRRDVLVPLFRAMHYLDVMEYHGGALEQGKDIVMWRRDPARERVNVAVVVKKGNITGQAHGGKSSAAGVAFQVQQRFGEPFQDPSRPDEQRTHEVLVVCSGTIRKEALLALNSALGSSGLARSVDYIQGERLWELVQEHLYQRAALAHLKEARRAFAEIYPGSRVAATFDSEGVKLAVAPGQGEPQPISLKLSFPQTRAGDAARQGFERHMRTGEATDIDGQYVQEFMADVLKALGIEQISKVHLGARTTQPAMLSLEVAAGPEKCRLENLHFEGIGGRDVVRLSTAGDQPYQFGVELDRSTRRFSFTVRFVAIPQNVRVALQLSAMQVMLSQPGVRVRLEVADSGLTVFDTLVEQGLVEPPDDGFLRLLEKVHEIQVRTNVAITIPAGDIPIDEAQHAMTVARIVETGKRVALTTKAKMNVGREFVSRLLQEMSSGKSALMARMITPNDEAEVFGSRIPLGIGLHQFDGLTVADSEAANLHTWLAGA